MTSSAGICSFFLDLFVDLLLWTAVHSVQSKYMAWISISCSSAWPGPHESSAPSGLSGLSFCFLKLLTNWKESFLTTVTKFWHENHLQLSPQCNIPHSALNWCSPPDPASSWCYRTWSNQIMLCSPVTCNMIWKTCERFPHSHSNLQSFLYDKRELVSESSRHPLSRSI